MKMYSFLVTAAMLFSGAAIAADASGKWMADVFNRLGGSQETTFNLKVEGARLTGTVSIRGAAREITDGKVSGDQISFAVIDKVRDLELKTVYTGKVTANSIQFESKLLMPPGGLGGFIPGPPTEFTVKRVP